FRRFPGVYTPGKHRKHALHQPRAQRVDRTKRRVFEEIPPAKVFPKVFLRNTPVWETLYCPSSVGLASQMPRSSAFTRPLTASSSSGALTVPCPNLAFPISWRIPAGLSFAFRTRRALKTALH